MTERKRDKERMKGKGRREREGGEEKQGHLGGFTAKSRNCGRRLRARGSPDQRAGVRKPLTKLVTPAAYSRPRKDLNQREKRTHTKWTVMRRWPGHKCEVLTGAWAAQGGGDGKKASVWKKA